MPLVDLRGCILPEKEKRLAICKFLLKEKFSSSMAQRPLHIQLKRFAIETDSPTELTAEEIKQTINEISEDDYFNDPKRTGTFKIKNKTIIRNFENSYLENKEIVFSFLSEDMESYIEYLIRRQRSIQEMTNPDYDVLKYEQSTKTLRYKGKIMELRSRGDDSIQINIFLLLWGLEAEYLQSNGEKVRLSNEMSYSCGDEIEIGIISDLVILRGAEGENIRSPQGDRFRPIRDAIRSFNKRTEKILGLEKIILYKKPYIKLILP